MANPRSKCRSCPGSFSRIVAQAQEKASNVSMHLRHSIIATESVCPVHFTLLPRRSLQSLSSFAPRSSLSPPPLRCRVGPARHDHPTFRRQTPYLDISICYTRGPFLSINFVNNVIKQAEDRPFS